MPTTDHRSSQAGQFQRLRRAAMLAGAVAVMWVHSASVMAQGYSLFIDPSKTANQFPAGMNAAGHVLATLCPADGECHPLVWNGRTGQNQRVVSAEQPDSSGGNAINNKDMVVGSYLAYNDSHVYTRWPAMWDREGRRTDLGLLPGSQILGDSDNATDINDHGVITVNSSTRVKGRPVVHAAIWRHGVLTDIDPNGLATRGPYRSFAYAINNHDTVVGSRGYGGQDGSQFRAVRWDARGAVELETLFPDSRQHRDSAVDINDHGVMIGVSSDVLSGEQAVRWVGTKVMALPKYADSDGWVVAHSINNHGVIVGTGFQGYLTPIRAMMWEGERAIDLNELLDPKDQARWRLLEAYAINDRGQIMGIAQRPDGSWDHLFVMTPR